MNTGRWASKLGWLSVGIGLAELRAAKWLTRRLGLRDERLARAYGTRELVTGIGLLASGSRGPRAAWIWGRVAGHALDLAILGAAVRRIRGSRRKNAAIALAALWPVVAIDLACASRLGSGSPRRPSARDASPELGPSAELGDRAEEDRRGPVRGYGEAVGRARGEQSGGGRAGNDLLENDQPRGVDEEGRLVGGTHGGPRTEHILEGQDPPDMERGDR